MNVFVKIKLNLNVHNKRGAHKFYNAIITKLKYEIRYKRGILI